MTSKNITTKTFRQTTRLLIDWPGLSGRQYRYNIHLIDTELKDLPGNYIFALKTDPHTWKPLFIGSTDSLKYRYGDQQNEALARECGATHIHTHPSEDPDQRFEEVADIIAHWPPIGNRS